MDPSEQQRKILLGHLKDFSNKFLNGLPASKAYSAEKADKAAFSIGIGVKSIEEILEIYSTEVLPKE